MKAWQFTEQPYYPAWDDTHESLRNSLPNRHLDPKCAADLYERYMDEWELCDELGINISINEHHATATCITPICHIPMAMLARNTKKVRLMSIGSPIANRPDPVRLAEEIAMIDCYSRGRHEMGFVRAGPFEVWPANAQPVGQGRRFYQAVWFVAITAGPGAWIGEQRVKLGTFLTGRESKTLFDNYRRTWLERGWGMPPIDNFGYMGIVGVGATEEEGKRRAHQICGYIRTGAQIARQFFNPPGYLPTQAVAAGFRNSTRKDYVPAYATVVMSDGSRGYQKTASMEQLIDAQGVFAGTPDQVFQQIKAYHHDGGGCGHLLIMGHGGDMNHADTVDNLTLFAKEVLPRLQALKAPDYELDPKPAP